MWLSTVLTTYDGCMTKPKVTNDTRDWIKPDFEHETARKNCALSFRLTLDTHAPGKLAPHKSKVFLKGELCRYPEGNTEFNSEIDDAECVEVSTIPVSKKERLFLSEPDERLRAVKSILLTQALTEAGFGTKLKEFTGYESEASKVSSVGEVSDMFSMFIRELSMLSATAYNWQINAEYLGEVSETSYQEVLKIKGLRYNEDTLKTFLSPFAKTGGFNEKTSANLNSAGMESTVSEMRVEDDESGEDQVAYLFKLESNKGMSFEHENGEVIRLLDNSKRSPLGKKSVKTKKDTGKTEPLSGRSY